MDDDRMKAVRSIADALNLPELAARILVARGIEDPDGAQTFLKPRLEDLSDPFLLPDMEEGVNRVIDAIRAREMICLYGDYDADGVTSTVLMANFLKHFDVDPIVYIPTRQEGYGLHLEAIDALRGKGVTLIVALDCGSSNIEEVRHAARCGVDTIIIDHHEAGTDLPLARAIINPKRKDSVFPTRDLAACGVAFFFLLALRRVLHARGLLTKTINLKKELDIVTIGTVGDMMPLTGDNRIIVKHGIKVMNKHPKAWLKSMHKSRVISKGIVDEFTLGFIIIPRINATGRVSKPEKSLRFLASEDEASAATFLADLQDANKHRQSIEEKILREIVADLKRQPLAERSSIVVYNEQWHVGVLGIVAQRLAETFKKPAIVLTKLNGIWKGSGRGAFGVDLFRVITDLSHLLIKYGGHKYACGVSIADENILSFIDAFEKSVKESAVAEQVEMKKTVLCDTKADFEELTLEFMDCVEHLSPFGIGNPRPNISLSPAEMIPLTNGRVKITDQQNRVWYGYLQADLSIPPARSLSCIVSPVLKEEMGRQFINLSVKEISPIA